VEYLAKQLERSSGGITIVVVALVVVVIVIVVAVVVDVVARALLSCGSPIG